MYLKIILEKGVTIFFVNKQSNIEYLVKIVVNDGKISEFHILIRTFAINIQPKSTGRFGIQNMIPSSGENNLNNNTKIIKRIKVSSLKSEAKHNILSNGYVEKWLQTC